MVKVFDLLKGDYVGVWSCSPEKAVIAVYAQSKNDYSTWNYEKRYSHLIKRGKHVVSCGDFTARI